MYGRRVQGKLLVEGWGLQSWDEEIEERGGREEERRGEKGEPTNAITQL